jgi:holo-[acyl-carrier protein] synthase
MKVGCGVDLIEVERISEAVKRWKDKFTRRVFTEKEINYSKGKKFYYQHLAARFATKEAVLKALEGEGRRFMNWRDVEILNKKNGKPEIKLHGHLKKLRTEKEIKNISVSISHTRSYAIANCVVIKNGEKESH